MIEILLLTLVAFSLIGIVILILIAGAIKLCFDKLIDISYYLELYHKTKNR